MTDTEREALEKAIKLYLDMGILGRVCQSTEKFLARVPGISTQRLQGLIKKSCIRNCRDGWGKGCGV